MKPKNFPERKNARRKATLERLEWQIETYRHNHPRLLPGTDESGKLNSMLAVADLLRCRIVESARDQRTKKSRAK